MIDIAAIKESITASILKSKYGYKVVNLKIGEYGKMHRLEINTENKTVSLEVHLKGEPSTIEVSIHDYEIRYEKSNGMLSAKSVTSNREWLSAILNNLLVNGEIKIDERKLSLFEKVLI